MRPDPSKTIEQRLRDFCIEFSERDRIYPLLQDLLLPLADQFVGLQARHADQISTEPMRWPKYLDATFWMFSAWFTANRIGLDEANQPQTILDIGTGPGYFPFLCRHYGHDVIGLDIGPPCFGDIAGIIGVKRLMVRVEPMVLLPDFGRRFSLVTAIATMFERLRPGPSVGNRYWSLAQWQFFLSDLMRNQLRYPGRIWIDLDRERRNGEVVFNPELIEFCAAHGSRVVADRGLIDWQLGQPVLPRQWPMAKSRNSVATLPFWRISMVNLRSRLCCSVAISSRILR